MTAHTPGKIVGSRVLLVDSDERVREGFSQFLGNTGAQVTATGDSEEALRVAGKTRFQVAVLDADSGGTELLQALKKVCPSLAPILLCTDMSFDTAVSAVRAGAVDVVPKAADSVQYLAERIPELCECAGTSHSGAVLSEALEVHEQFLQRMIDTSRRATDAEEKRSGQSEERPSLCRVLVVDGNPQMADGLHHALGKGTSYEVTGASSGGEALLAVGQGAFQMAVINGRLADIRAETLADSIEAEQTECIVLILYPPDGRTPGSLQLVEHGRRVDLVSSLTESGQLVTELHKLWTGFGERAKQRRYLRVFRREHGEFLDGYVALRRKLVEAIEGSSSS